MDSTVEAIGNSARKRVGNGVGKLVEAPVRDAKGDAIGGRGQVGLAAGGSS